MLSHESAQGGAGAIPDFLSNAFQVILLGDHPGAPVETQQCDARIVACVCPAAVPRTTVENYHIPLFAFDLHFVGIAFSMCGAVIASVAAGDDDGAAVGEGEVREQVGAVRAEGPWG